MRSLSPLALAGCLVVSSVGCKPVKKALRGKNVTVKPTASATLTKVDGKPRTFVAKISVKTEPEATVSAHFFGDTYGDKSTKAAKDGAAELSFEWDAAHAKHGDLEVKVFKKEPKRLLGLADGDEKQGSTLVRLEEPWSFDGTTCHGAGPSCEVKDAFGARVSATTGTKISWTGGQLVAKGTQSAEPLVLPPAEAEKLALHAFDYPRFKLTFPVTLTFPDGKSATSSVSFSSEGAQTEYLAKLPLARNGPVALPGDDAMPAKARVLWASGCKTKQLGKPTKLSDFDLVAFCGSKMRERVCGPYHSRSGKSASFELHMYDQEITVHERRTGKVRAKRTFTAPSLVCPSSFKGKGSSSDGSWPDEKVMEAWLRSFVQAP